MIIIQRARVWLYLLENDRQRQNERQTDRDKQNRQTERECCVFSQTEEGASDETSKHETVSVAARPLVTLHVLYNTFL